MYKEAYRCQNFRSGNYTYSDWERVRCVVPQGFIYFIFLFFIYIKMIYTHGKCESQLVFFADYTIAIRKGKHCYRNTKFCQWDLKELGGWFAANGLVYRKNYNHVFSLSNPPLSIISPQRVVTLCGMLSTAVILQTTK